MKRFVLDTNVVVSALSWGGLSQKTIDIIQQNSWGIITTKALIDELIVTLDKPKLSPILAKVGKPASWFITQYTTLVTWVLRVFVPSDVTRDPKDVIVLACVIGGQADAIVTGDKDLLVLTNYQNIAIMSPQTFVSAYGELS